MGEEEMRSYHLMSLRYSLLTIKKLWKLGRKWWLYNTVNALDAIEFNTLEWLVLCYVNCTSISYKSKTLLTDFIHFSLYSQFSYETEVRGYVLRKFTSPNGSKEKSLTISQLVHSIALIWDRVFFLHYLKRLHRIDAFNSWYWRLLRVPWTARNKPVNPKGNEHRLEGLMLKLMLQYFGHLMQRADSLEKTLILGKIEGKRRKGQQRIWDG